MVDVDTLDPSLDALHHHRTWAEANQDWHPLAVGDFVRAHPDLVCCRNDGFRGGLVASDLSTLLWG